MSSLSLPKAELLLKTQNINIKNFKNFRNKYTEVKIPKSAKSYSIAALIDNNGNKVDIITFRNKVDGKKIGDVVRQYFISTGLFGKEVKKKDFIPEKSELVDGIFSSKSRRIETEVVLNGKCIEKINQTQAVTDIPNGTVVHIKEIRSRKYDKDCNTEYQSLYSYQKGMQRKGYEIAPYLRTKNRYLNPEKFRFHFEGFGLEEIKKLISDKYLPLHLYTFKEFKAMAPSVAIHPGHKIRIPAKIVWRKDMADNEFGDMNADIFKNKKTVLLNENLNKGRNMLINSAAHENEHAYECEQIHNLMVQDIATENYILDQTIKNYEQLQEIKKIFPVDNVAKATNYKWEYIKYVKQDVNPRAYYNQPPEIRARFASIITENQYYKSSQRLKSEFPYAPDSFIGSGEAEKIDYDFMRNFTQEKSDIEMIKKMEYNYSK